jgi:hypothetical protein
MWKVPGNNRKENKLQKNRQLKKRPVRLKGRRTGRWLILNISFNNRPVDQFSATFVAM